MTMVLLGLIKVNYADVAIALEDIAFSKVAVPHAVAMYL